MTLANQLAHFKNQVSEKKALTAEFRKSRLFASFKKDSSFSPPIPKGCPFELMPYQRAGVDYMLTNPFPCNFPGDPPGLGKTAQSIAFCNCIEWSFIIIIAPLTLLENWRRELKTWLVGFENKKIQIIKTGEDDVDPSADIVLLSYDLAIKLMILGQVMGRDIDVLICDEFHYLKNKYAKRTKAVLGILAPKSKRQIFISGTPILNRPMEIYPALSSLCPQAIGWMTKNEFAYKFCDAKMIEVTDPKTGEKKMRLDDSGASNLDELGQRMRVHGMFRRKKSEVLTQLPPKRIEIVQLPSEGFSEEDFKKRLDEAERFKYEAVANASHNYAFDELSIARRLMGEAKITPSVEFCKTILESGVEKIIVFAHHKTVVAGLMEGLKEFDPVRVVGGMKPEDRQDSIDRFQKDKNCRVIVLNLKAGGVGINLTAASHVIFVEWSWVPGENHQALDRAHRIGQENDVIGYFLTYEDSLERVMLQRHIEKNQVIKEVLND